MVTNKSTLCGITITDEQIRVLNDRFWLSYYCKVDDGGCLNHCTVLQINKELFNWDSDKYTHNPLVLYDKSSSFSKGKTNREVFNIGKFLLDLLTDYQTLQKCDFIKIDKQFAVDADLSEHTYNSVYVDGVNMTQLFNDLQNIELFIYSSTNNIDELVTNFSVEELTNKFYQNLSFKIDNESHTIDITLGNFIIDVLFALDCVINL